MVREAPELDIWEEEELIINQIANNAAWAGKLDEQGGHPEKTLKHYDW